MTYLSLYDVLVCSNIHKLWHKASRNPVLYADMFIPYDIDKISSMSDENALEFLESYNRFYNIAHKMRFIFTPDTYRIKHTITINLVHNTRSNKYIILEKYLDYTLDLATQLEQYDIVKSICNTMNYLPALSATQAPQNHDITIVVNPES